ncbi:MAG: rhodanese-like domain-containing protein [Saprospiraceae bacterium]|nr:rhodanese-like domain-containing protein [Saprospiraceae bacterium]MBK7810590.1 rhodanese-like domain-containing protein [Saprospiraceae bacterium]MBK9630181.1 rhodanese-like domain-containing protein [Saprospiraceae bacterium]
MEDITVGELSTRLQNGEKPNIIDVRELYEHQEFNIGGDLATLQTSFPFKIQELKGRENEEFIVYCRSGNRSGMAKHLMVQSGFKNVKNLIGGMLAWQEMYKTN